MAKSIIIIGAGIAGMSTGCYGQMNGYETRIFEMHSKPGGLCTSWKRKGYTIGTPGWLMGSAPANNFRSPIAHQQSFGIGYRRIAASTGMVDLLDFGHF